MREDSSESSIMCPARPPGNRVALLDGLLNLGRPLLSHRCHVRRESYIAERKTNRQRDNKSHYFLQPSVGLMGKVLRTEEFNRGVCPASPGFAMRAVAGRLAFAEAPRLRLGGPDVQSRFERLSSEAAPFPDPTSTYW